MNARLLVGDCRAMLRTLEPESVHVCCTSIPYWGLRAYGTEPQVWGVTDPDCPHEWGAEQPGSNRGGSGTPTDKNGRGEGYGRSEPRGQFCQRCDAWRGELGLEPSLSLFLAHIVEVFREVRRVLRRDGTLWLNVGDTFAQGGSRATPAELQADAARAEEKGYPTEAFAGYRGWDRAAGTAVDGLKPKDLCMVPHRVAIALQDDGWWIRMDNVWAKRNPMPESITDRPTKAHEYVFLCSRSERYFYDADAVREKFADERMGNPGAYDRTTQAAKGANRDRQDLGFLNNGGGWERGAILGGRNLRSVWEINPQPFPEAHFATFPEELPRRAILAGTSEHGACAACGAPWRRVVERERTFESGSGRSGNLPNGKNGTGMQGGGATVDVRRGPCVQTQTLGWEPTCACNDPREPSPCVVLDPFAGSGTTLAVALRHGRAAIGIELQPEYAEIARRRVGKEQSLFTGAIDL